MRIFHEVRYLWSNFSDTFTQKNIPTKLQNKKYFTNYPADKLGHTKRQTDAINIGILLNPSLISTNLATSKCKKNIKITFSSIMRIFHEVRYLWSNFSDTFTQKNIPTKLQNKKYFTNYPADKLGHTKRQTDGRRQRKYPSPHQR